LAEAPDIIHFTTEKEMIAVRQDLVGHAEQRGLRRLRLPIRGGEVAPAVISLQPRGPPLQIPGNVAERRVRQEIGPFVEELISNALINQSRQAIPARAVICFDKEGVLNQNGAIRFLGHIGHGGPIYITQDREYRRSKDDYVNKCQFEGRGP
jgi:hypothetical protein